MADEVRTCDKCGRTFKSDGAWYAKHALKCDGTPATSGRIAQPVIRKTKSKRAGSRPGRTARRSPRQASPFAAAIHELEAKRAAALTEADKLAGAISALEALAS